ncbi:hypothetical protein BY996DRAFT_6551058, partial [Phakopsora pachyrhizi]
MRMRQRKVQRGSSVLIGSDPPTQTSPKLPDNNNNNNASKKNSSTSKKKLKAKKSRLIQVSIDHSPEQIKTNHVA